MGRFPPDRVRLPIGTAAAKRTPHREAPPGAVINTAPSLPVAGRPVSTSGVPEQLTERPIHIDRPASRQAEGPLAKDVVLDLIGAAGDRLGWHRNQNLGDDAAEGPSGRSACLPHRRSARAPSPPGGPPDW